MSPSTRHRSWSSRTVDRLTSCAEREHFITYRYDGLNRRIRMEDSLGAFDSLDFYWNLSWKCVETRLTETGAVKTQYLYGDSHARANQ